MAIGTLSSTWAISVGWTASNQPAASNLAATTNPSTINAKSSAGNSVANAVAGGADELISAITTIAASGSASIDFTSQTDIMATSGVSLARIKDIMVQLLSVAQDATYGTACTSVTLGNAGVNGWISQSFSGGFGSATSKIDLPGGATFCLKIDTAAGVAVDSTHKVLLVTNNDSGHAAAVQLTVAGGTT